MDGYIDASIWVYRRNDVPRTYSSVSCFLQGGLSAAPARAVSAVKNMNLPEIPRNINIGDINIKVPNLSPFWTQLGRGRAGSGGPALAPMQSTWTLLTTAAFATAHSGRSCVCWVTAVSCLSVVVWFLTLCPIQFAQYGHCLFYERVVGNLRQVEHICCCANSKNVILILCFMTSQQSSHRDESSISAVHLSRMRISNLRAIGNNQ